MEQSHSASFVATAPGITQDNQHIILSDPSWALWRWTLLRGTGFPITSPLRLAVPATLREADAIVRAEDSVQHARAAAIARVRGALSDDAEQRKPLTNALHTLHAGKIPTLVQVPPDLHEAISALADAHARRDALTATFPATHDAAIQTASATLREIVGTAPFQEAIVWQNRRLRQNGIDYFLGKPLTTTARDYQRNRSVLVKYLQRYTTKNDTIGFFGPVGWVRWDANADQTRFAAGPHLLAQRTTYVEGWGINALGQAIAADPALLPWATPRLAPQIHIGATTLHIPFVKPLPLTPAQRAVLLACTGEVPAHVIATRLVGQGIPGLANAEDVYAILAQMQRVRRITWSFDVTLETPFPERALRRQLTAITSEPLRTAAVAKLDAFDDAVKRVTAARANPAHLDAAMAALETTFTELTGASATRSAGQVYAGRTLVYEDCARDITMTLGTNLLAALDRPLALMLTSGRWLAYHLAEACRAYFHATHAELAQKNGSPTVEFAEFFPWVNAHLTEMSEALFGPTRAEFQAKWADILALPAGQRDVRRATADIAGQVADAFAAPGPGWSSARYHSPDIMLAATGIDAIARGDFQFVMGELHLGLNTLWVQLFTQQHPRISELHEVVAQDVPEPQVVPLSPAALVPATRSQPSLTAPRDFRLIASADVCDAPPDRQLRLGDLVVEAVGGRAQVRTRDGRHTFDALDLFGDYFSLIVADYFDIIAKGPHTPRITIDRLVVQREAWRIPVSAVAPVAAQDAATSYLNTVRWARGLALPQYLFYRTPTERKPTFLDLASPLSVDLFVREVRRLVNNEVPAESLIAFSEMLPGPEHAWLTDAQGNRYTSELRVAAVDRKDRL